jgi:hypothetical protein
MKKINIRKTYYLVRHRYLTMNNVVIAVALIIGAGWAWGSVGMMQRNFELQKELDAHSRQLVLAQLQTDNLAYEQRYYKSSEYQELAIRDRMGLAMPGEKALILPPNSTAAKNADTTQTGDTTSKEASVPPSNFELWMNFLFGSRNETKR